MKTKTPPEMATMFDMMNADAITKTDDWARYIDEGLTNGKGRATVISKEMVQNIATELGIGVEDAKRILKDYLGVAATEIEPVNTALETLKGTVEDIIGMKLPPGMTLSDLIFMPTGEITGGGLLTGGAQGGNLSPVLRKAQGGITRDPQITNRPILWGEAGPEAYIPLGMDKRYQSTRLLNDVADMFGYRLMHFADGGIYRSPASNGGGGGLTINLGGINVEARVAAGVDMDYAARVISAKVEAGVKAAFDRLGREMVVRSWRN